MSKYVVYPVDVYRNENFYNFNAHGSLNIWAVNRSMNREFADKLGLKRTAYGVSGTYYCVMRRDAQRYLSPDLESGEEFYICEDEQRAILLAHSLNRYKKANDYDLTEFPNIDLVIGSSDFEVLDGVGPAKISLIFRMPIGTKEIGGVFFEISKLSNIYAKYIDTETYLVMSYPELLEAYSKYQEKRDGDFFDHTFLALSILLPNYVLEMSKIRVEHFRIYNMVVIKNTKEALISFMRDER